jgi:tRNA U34 5-methylaminomethyl-2-thiouridine-forming methyltransferase MnmC
MERVITITADGSETLYLPGLDEHYHSVNGAIGESMHVFIEAGFDYFNSDRVSVFEAGFGTGLNALLTAVRSGETKRKTIYTTIEKYPVEKSLLDRLNYGSLLGNKAAELFMMIHDAEWDMPVRISDYFEIRKIRGDIIDDPFYSPADIIYFDMFGFSKQPEGWAFEVLAKTCSQLGKGGIFVTYSSRGELRRNLITLGFSITRLPGASGKREMLRAIKM